MSESVRVHVLVEGVVQGVFFRANTRRVAQSMDLTGWVRNLSDGRVEILAEGPEERVDDFVRWCRKGPSFARVDHTDIIWAKPTGEFTSFEIRG
jgi:acylphosphatase